MIEKIYRNKYMVTCDNCGTGQECDNWAEVIDFMNEEGWKKKLVDDEGNEFAAAPFPSMVVIFRGREKKQ